ncbi:MAG: D-aminoacylase [Firmicutes bacterium]|nr:D-aminoacylase [Bacillota bacterium]
MTFPASGQGCGSPESSGRETVFRRAMVIDGTGAPSRPGDVVVRGDRVVAVTPPGSARAAPDATQVDADGLFVAPGFIDIHSHSDLSIFLEPAATNYVAQGVTLLVSGNCGWSAAPFDPEDPEAVASLGDDRLRSLVTWRTFEEYMEALERLPKAVHVATLVGHSSVRGAALGWGDVRPGPEDLEKMQVLVEEAMRAGAFGLSTGLIYVPGTFAGTDEIVALARVAAAHGGIYATHLRSESDRLPEALEEAVRVGRESGARVQVSHHKASGRRNWGLVKTTLALMEHYRRFGVEVTCDVYPCTAGATGLAALLPPWTQREGRQACLGLLRDPAAREKVRWDLGRPQAGWPNLYYDAGPEGVRVAETRHLPRHLGRSLADIARETGADPRDVLMDLLLADFDLGVTVAGMSEEDVRFVLGHRLSMVASDAAAVVPGEGAPHPRSYRAFTRTLATYARDERLLSLETAVHKMTGLPAWKLGLWDRGLLRPGAKADLVVFDLWGLRSRSDYGDPHHLSEGVVHVLVAGEFVWRDGRPTGARPGETLRRPGC